MAPVLPDLSARGQLIDLGWADVGCEWPSLVGQVHVWCIPLRRSAPHCEWLSAEELARAGCFVFPKDRDRYLGSHCQLRKVLARYLQLNPRELVFSVNAYGKPGLVSTGYGPLFFNLSHSGEYALLGVTDIAELGVDVEMIRPSAATLALAQRTFSPAEYSALAMLLPGRFVEAFFALWARKESFIKSMGLGLSMSLQDFDVSVEPDQRPRLIQIRVAGEEPSDWFMTEPPPLPGYRAALALRAAASQVDCRFFMVPDE